MAARLPSVFARIVALTAILVLGSATISFAADNQFGATTTPNEVTVAPPQLVTIPDVRGQAYVFAKGTLEEGGFAWRVAGAVQGYPANTVVSQVPAAGTRVVDTGMPTIQLGLARNGSYAQEGAPENTSPYDGTAIKLPGRPKPAAKPKPRPKPVAKPKPKPKAAAKPKPKAISKPAARPEAFRVAGAPAEPLDEAPLTTRARRLERWLATHRRPTTANVNHWLYQHEWIVTGARFGWWRGDQALEILIRVDEQVQRRWNIGSRSEAAARRALAAVRAKSR
ncbi:MAG TPA: PASTA domain-containing protein [Gaiellaceae bacterium]|nr:PASTA domain-containing protein [Gaiellaceae bacterium]